MPEVQETIKLTQYSHGAGCGCKISPLVLDKILKSNFAMPDNDKLIVGNHSKDDAAVLDLGNGKALISTTDFFMPIVDDPFQFGRIASANAISDVYAMGGKPILAIAILGWPVNTLPPELAQQNNGLQQALKVSGYPTIWLLYTNKDEATNNFNLSVLGSLGYPRNPEPGKEQVPFLNEANSILAQGKSN